jgi:pyruvate dehydrogenase E2 component (dihydrolipoamide acetyltransferase)
MANLKITVPDMGDFKDVEVIEVLVKEGQTINKNDSIITLESDKSSVEVPSTHSGKIGKINVSVGDKINKGDLILTLESSENKEEIKKEEPKKENKVDTLVPAKETTKKNPILPIPQSGRSSASPKVRRFARELGADVSIVPGSQRLGRVSEDDVKNFIRSQVTVNQGAVQKKEASKYLEEYPHEEFGEVLDRKSVV